MCETALVRFNPVVNVYPLPGYWMGLSYLSWSWIFSFNTHPTPDSLNFTDRKTMFWKLLQLKGYFGIPTKPVLVTRLYFFPLVCGRFWSFLLAQPAVYLWAGLLAAPLLSPLQILALRNLCICVTSTIHFNLDYTAIIVGTMTFFVVELLACMKLHNAPCAANACLVRKGEGTFINASHP